MPSRRTRLLRGAQDTAHGALVRHRERIGTERIDVTATRRDLDRIVAIWRREARLAEITRHIDAHAEIARRGMEG